MTLPPSSICVSIASHSCRAARVHKTLEAHARGAEVSRHKAKGRARCYSEESLLLLSASTPQALHSAEGLGHGL